ncbi:DUF6575 domain-containing protein [Alishewanella sp. HH-ZS]|uniref:DUF6575 domain-containing protein n=1 Tax=Alishewanella sp. HH-ZS TaxID=1856684 RepID=UPI0008235DB5|nr:DUF6575 domain-containing protein [Alishewanella sp. HH-ZS]OCW96369.1 hypothetical protein A9165_12105 [Alishewanella sp. HH-ZS]
MRKPEKLLFRKTVNFGSLYYYNSYSYYLEPITFSARNEFGHLFFCYSLGLDDDDLFERWVINPISEQFLNQIEQKNISLYDAILPKDRDNIFILKEYLEEDKSEVISLDKKRIAFALPNKDVFISENINIDGSRKHSHKIRLFKSSQKPIASDILNKTTEQFISFCKNYLDSFQIPLKIFSEDAVHGSFVFRVKIDELDSISQCGGFEKLSSLSDMGKFLHDIDNYDIDQRQLKYLLDTLVKHGINIELIDESSTNTLFSLTDGYAKNLVPEIASRLSNYLDSSMVPQADSLDTLKNFLVILNTEGIVTADSFGLDKRQVSYYRDACQLLGLVHSYGALTPLGLKASIAESEKVFLEIIKGQFENTECATIWMAQQSVSNLIEIDESTATQFLIDNCKNLGESTSKRRASTLRSWVKSFKKHLVNQ